MLTYPLQIDFRGLNGWPGEEVPPPKYPFVKKKTRFAPMVPSYMRKLLPPTRPLNSERLRISALLPEPWMADHVIDRSTIVSASTYLEMALEFPGVTGVWDCHFDSAFAISESGPASTLEVRKESHKFQILSSSNLTSGQNDPSWTRSGPVFDRVHAHGKLAYGMPHVAMRHINVKDVLSRCSFEASAEMVYEEFRGIAQFGPTWVHCNISWSVWTELTASLLVSAGSTSV